MSKNDYSNKNQDAKDKAQSNASDKEQNKSATDSGKATSKEY